MDALQKTEDKKDFCIEIEGIKSAFPKIRGSKTSYPQNLCVEGVHKKSAQGQNLANNEKSTLLIQSS